MTRKDAIKHIKMLFSNGLYTSLSNKTKEALDVLIPELHESEDDRIRKSIIECVKEQIRQGNYLNINGDKAIAYLEKQKEQKPNVEICPHSIKSKSYKENGCPIEDCDYGLEIAYDILKKTFGEVRGYQTDDGIREHQTAIKAVRKAKEQKPAEWKPQSESLEALRYAIEGKWEMIKPTSYLSRRLEDLYEELVSNFNVDETLIADKDIEELKALKAETDASMEKESAEHTCANDESEYDKGYRDGHKFGLQQTENYTIGKTFKGLIPCWINAPSELQSAHQYHGKNVVVMHENNGGFRCVCIDDEKPVTFHLPDDVLLVEGWRKRNPEWSEEDKKIIETICKEGDLKPSEKRWLKSLRPQPKREIEICPHSVKSKSYSETGYPIKDCDYGLEIAADILRKTRGKVQGYQSDDGLREHDTAIAAVENADKFLRPHWKPSEEQMEAFRSYIKDFQEKAEAAVGGWNNFDVMIRLFEQLKAL